MRFSKRLFLGLVASGIIVSLSSIVFAIPTNTSYSWDNQTITSSGDTDAVIIIDPVTKKIYVTTGFFQNTDEDTTTSGSITGDIVENDTGDSTDTATWEHTNDIRDNYIISQSDTGTQTNNNTEQTQDTPTDETIPENTPQDQLSEYHQALAWMYANHLTKYSDPEAYRPQDYLTREESAKIIWQLYATLWYDQTPTHTTSCAFLDEKEFDPSLSWYIQKVCSRWLFKWYQWNYMPHQSLTKPQTIAVLMRMFEGKASDESQTPWWWKYYLKGQAIGVVNAWNMQSYDRPITREEVALYVFRLKNIVLNKQLKIMSFNTIADINNKDVLKEDDTSSIDPNIIHQNLDTLAKNINAWEDPELQEAVQWMYDNGLTMYPSVEEYAPFTTLTREWAAKILHIFAQLFKLDGDYDLYLPNECEFSDIDTVGDALKEHIQSVCKLWLLKGVNNKFNPWTEIKKSEYVVALIRMLEWKHLDETGDPRWKNYFEKAQELGIVWPSDAISFEWPITRYEVALFLYRFKIKYQMLNNLNSSRLQNEVVSTVEGSVTTWTNNLQEAKVYVDTNLIKDPAFEIGYVEIFGERYKLVRTANEEYDIPWSFVRYGDLYDLVEDKKVGTISFIVSNGLMIEWTIRFTSNNKRFTIQSLADTQAYYQLKEITN